MFKLIISLIVYLGIPVFLRAHLNSGISLHFLLSFGFARFIFITLASLHVGRKNLRLTDLLNKKLFKILYITAGFILALITIVGILITPFSAYKIWFQSVSERSQHGVVSNLFVLISSFLLSGIDFYSASLLISLMLLGIILCGIFMLIYQTPILFLLFISLSLFLFFYRAVFINGYSTDSAGISHKFLANLSFGVIIFILASAASLAYSPSGSEIVDSSLHPGLRKAVVSVLPRFPLLYGLPGYGHSFSAKKLGRTPILSSSPIFKITRGDTIRPVYLRTSVFDYYTGRSWENNLKIDSMKDIEVSGKLKDFSMKVEILPEYYYLLPHTIYTKAILIKTTGKNNTLSGSLDTGFISKKPFKSGDTIYIKENLNDPLGKRRVLKPLKLKNYLQIPAEFPKNVENLASVLKSGNRLYSPDNREQTAALLDSIERYLAKNYIYSLKASAPGAGKDFVSDFLFHTRKGYCVHFATAFVILARLCGIPARYVTGFLVIPAETVTVTGLQAHAWPEVWLPRKGWVPWEATPAVNAANFVIKDKSLIYNYRFHRDRLTEMQIIAILGRGNLLLQKNENEERSFLFQNKKVLIRLLPVIIILVLAFLLAKVYINRIIFLLMTFPFAGNFNLFYLIPNIRIKFLKYLLKKVSRAGERGTGIYITYSGWLLWIENLSKLLHMGNERTKRLSKIILSSAYSNNPVGIREFKYLVLIYNKYIKKDSTKLTVFISF